MSQRNGKLVAKDNRAQPLLAKTPATNKQRERSFLTAAMMLHKSSPRGPRPMPRKISMSASSVTKDGHVTIKNFDVEQQDKSRNKPLSPKYRLWQLGVRHNDILDKIAALEKRITGHGGVEADNNVSQVKRLYWEARRVRDQIKACEDEESRLRTGSPKHRKPKSPKTSPQSRNSSPAKLSPLQTAINQFQTDREETLEHIKYLRTQIRGRTGAAMLECMDDLEKAQLELVDIDKSIAQCCAAERRELRTAKTAMKADGLSEEQIDLVVTDCLERDGGEPEDVSRSAPAQRESESVSGSDSGGESESESDRDSDSDSDSGVDMRVLPREGPTKGRIVVEGESLPMIKEPEKMHFGIEWEDLLYLAN